jgi:hypothetical protein
MRRLGRASLACALLALSACGGSDSPTGNTDNKPTPTVAAVVFTTSPADQVVGTAVPVQVRVDNTSGQPMANQAVTFSATAGTVTPSSGTTDALGLLSASWALGTTAGSQTLTASASGKSALASVTARAAAASSFEKVSGDAQTGAAGDPLPQPLVVAVKDQFGNARSGESLTVALTAGGGSVGSTSPTTGSDGRASIAWTLGQALGSNGLSVTHALGSLTFTATARPGAPAAIAALSGGGQTAAAGTALANPLVVEVKDRLGHLVSGAKVAFVATAGGGKASSDTVATGIDGRAQATWTLGGTAGAQTLEARVQGAGAASFGATAVAGPASKLEVASGSGQTGTVGQNLSQPVVVKVSDVFGNGVAGAAVSFSTTTPGGQATPAQGTTGANGQLSTTWKLGNTAGTQTLTASATGLAAATATATAAPGAAATVRAASGSGQTGTVGQALANPLVAEVVDAFGNVVSGVTVTFTPAASSGTVSASSGATGSNGRVSTNWTLGTTSGTQTVTALASGATPASFTATANPRAAQTFVVVSGNNQTGPATSPLASPLLVAARDTFGNGVPGVSVTFSVTAGGGSVSPASATTGATGTASTTFTLGPTVGTHTAQATAGTLGTVSFTATGTAVSTGYDIEIRVIGSMSAAVQAAFAAAEARWEQVVTGDLPNVSLTASEVSQCGDAPSVAINVDDLVIYAEVKAIDGVGKILGQAGPCWGRDDTWLPILGTMEFDEADMASMAADGTLGDVILHEMGHVLGFGTVWDYLSLQDTSTAADPYFTGAGAKAAYAGLGASIVNGVPLENTGDEGTRLSHWRETRFRTELMTGWISGAGNPLSIVTVRSMADLGYTVNAGAADAYALPSPSPARVAEPGTGTPWERLLKPRGAVTPEGVRVPIR